MAKTDSYVYKGSSGLLRVNAFWGGAASHGGKVLPCSFDARSRMIFSAVGSCLVERGSRNDVSTFLSLSARSRSSWHFLLSRAFSDRGASPRAFMYNSAAWMACCKASSPERSAMSCSCSCPHQSANHFITVAFNCLKQIGECVVLLPLPPSVHLTTSTNWPP
jgi:hypothetical protein